MMPPSHRRRRISRVLLGVLALTIVVGVFACVRKLSSTKANEVAAAGAAAGAVPQSQPVTQPATQPQSQPSVATVTVEPAKQTLPQPQSQSQSQPQPPLSSAGPLRTETPSAAVAQTAAAKLAPAPAAAPVAQPKGPIALVAAAPAPASASEPSKVLVKPYRPPAGTHSTATAAEAIAEARAKIQAGKMLEARDALNGPFVTGRFKGPDADAARALLAEINQTVVFSPKKFADDRFGGTYQVQSGDRLDRIGAKYSVTSDLLMRINGMTDPRRLRAGAYIKVLKGPFHAVVSKSAFRLDLYLGGLPGPSAGDSVAYVTSFPVGLGKDSSTPLGKWQVEQDRKVKNPVYYSPRGEGVIEADDPKNPLGEFWIGLAGLEGEAQGKESYGIHGTIDPSSIGKQESMGCIRLRNEDVAVVFSALTEGKSTVLVVE